jgi:uncharacterized membrane protein YdjX (TVP38/TMEM64 family)
MTKKGSIFNFFPEYLHLHPIASLSWVWVALAPAIGSLLALKNYELLLQIQPQTFIEHSIFILGAALVMGFAILPTTFTALLSGFVLGWMGLFDILVAYTIANVIGYSLGKAINADFLEVLTLKSPNLQSEINQRKGNLGKLIFFIRISPIIPFAISNFLFASLQIPLRKVLLYGVPGMLPRTALAFLAGILANDFLNARENLKDPMQVGFLIFFLVLSVWGIWYNWKKAGKEK